jgi:PAS domain S-box-containing protein
MTGDAHAGRDPTDLLASFLEACPDAVLLISGDGTILRANARACALVGYGVSELVGEPVSTVLPAATDGEVPQGHDLHLLHRDGHPVAVDIQAAPTMTTTGPGVAVFVRDVGERRRDEGDHDADVDRRHALELNDTVMQGLATAIWLLETGSPERSAETLRGTMAAVRDVIADLLGQESIELSPGGLVRSTPDDADADDTPVETTATPGRIHVMIADDSADVRQLLRSRLMEIEDVEVVAEASNGEEAIVLADHAALDVVVLDLSMPRMDGLETASVLRARHPDLRIVVLSGHPSKAMRDVALRAGADAYCEKGGDFAELEREIRMLQSV